MGQADILKILEKNGGWMTVEEIQRKKGNSPASIGRALKILYRHGEVLRKRDKINCGKRNLWRTKSK